MSIFRFASFALDTARYELTNEGRPVELPRLPMDILILLLERDGNLLMRSEIAGRIWPDSDPADVVPRINTAMNRIRNALGDDPATPAYIQTVIGKGYRFIAPVTVEDRNGLSPNAPDLLPAEPDVPPTAALLPSPSRRRPRLLALPAVLLLVLAGWLTARRFNHAGASHGEPYTLTRFTSNQSGDRITAAAISPDGRLVAYADADGVRLKRIEESGSQAIPTPLLREVDRLAWFADETHLALSGVGKDSDVPEVWLLSTTGSAPVLWRKNARRATPAAAGTRIAYTDSSGSELWVADDLLHEPRRVFQGQREDSFPLLAWTSNGKTLLAAHFRGRNPSGPLTPRTPDRDTSAGYFALNADTGAITAAHDDVRMDDGCMGPRGELLFSQPQKGAIGIWKVPVDPKTGAFLQPPRQILVTTMDAHDFSIAATGDIASVVQIANTGISIANFHADPPSIDHIEPLTFSTNEAYPHSWTPDSRSLYFEQQQEEAPRLHRYRLVKQQLGSHDPEALTPTPGDQAMPMSTPDGKWILFIGRDDLNAPYQLFRVSADKGSPSPVPTRGPVGEIRCPLRGTTCVLRRAESQNVAFYLLDPVAGLGRKLYELPSVPDSLGGWDVSPDGSSLALATTNPLDAVLHLVDLASGASTSFPILVHSRVSAVHWAVNQAGWFITTRTVTGSDLFYLDRTGRVTLLHQTSNLSWIIPSPDGHKLAFVDQNTDSNVWLLRSGR